MRFRFLFAALAATVLYSCVQSEPVLRTGDLVFTSIPPEKGEPDEPIYIHASIVEVDSEGEWIIDATSNRGVARYPVKEFISDFRRHDGSYPAFELMRLKDTTGVSAFISNAKSYIGEPYDTEFASGNGKHYCTELIYDSYVRDGAALFDEVEMNFKNKAGEYPSFWVRIFGRIGAEIPQGKTGTDPYTMRHSNLLEPAGCLIP